MKNFLYIALFTVGISVFYTAIAQVLPQLENRPPRVLNWGEALNAEELVSAGAEVFEANCVQCHKIGQPGGRCPDLAGIGQKAAARAATRRPGATDVDYLVESLCDPGAYLADGFANMMPGQSKLLSGPQMIAVTAFMQDQGGAVTVSVKDAERSRALLLENGCATSAGGAPAAVADAKPVGSPEEAFQEFGCAGCHLVDKPDKSVGPSLYDIGARQDQWQIYESLVDPDAQLAPGYPAGLMKATLDGNGFYERMGPADFKAMVDWLSGLQG